MTSLVPKAFLHTFLLALFFKKSITAEYKEERYSNSKNCCQKIPPLAYHRMVVNEYPPPLSHK